MFARSKLSKTSEALINNEISDEDFPTTINEDKSYRELKESIRMMKSQRSDTEKNNLMQEDKNIGTDEIISRNEIINDSLKTYCSKYKKIQTT